MSKRCHKAKMTKKSREIARNFDFHWLHSLAYVFWKGSYKKIWIKMMKNLQNTAFLSLCWRAKNGENLYIWSSCPNMMLSNRHWDICYHCCFRILSNIDGKQFRTIFFDLYWQCEHPAQIFWFSDFKTLWQLIVPRLSHCVQMSFFQPATERSVFVAFLMPKWAFRNFLEQNWEDYL